MGAVSSPGPNGIIPLQAFEFADSDHPNPALEWVKAEGDIEWDSVFDEVQRIA